MTKKMTMAKLADNPRMVQLPKTDNQKIVELKRLLIDSAGKNVVAKAIEIALNDEHPAQGAMIKLCMDRMLPMSMFEKANAQRSAVSITITGIGEVSVRPPIEQAAEAEDAEIVEEKHG